MNILGICGGIRAGNWDASAALVQNGVLVSAAEEERFLRVKHAPGTLPTHSIRYCLRNSKISIQDVDRVVFPGISYKNMKSRLEAYFRFTFGHVPKIELCHHHEAHAASTYFTSGYDRALIATYDFSGDGLSSTLSVGDGLNMKIVREWPFPNSLGLYYAMMTQHLGFDWGEDEYKVMGLASYGKADTDVSWLLKSEPGGYVLDPEMIRKTLADEPPLSTQECLYSHRLEEKFGPRRMNAEKPGSTQMNLAASVQHQLETVVISMLKDYAAETGIRKLCIAGGVGMNCVLNQKLAECGDFDEVYLPPVAGDNGLACGAALLVSAREGKKLISKLPTAALGPAYTADQIRKSLEEVGATFQEVSDPAAEAADWIARGKIIGWHQGGMEYGARALGHRSILANPGLEDMKDKVNAVIKFREGFRPFAPSVLAEDSALYFEKSSSSPFMTRTFDVIETQKKVIPAVTHADGTARVQTVDSKDEPLYHQLLTEVRARTGCGMVLNTSFNIRGQPIVENPNQAISTFYGSGLDALLIGSFLLKK